MNKDSGNLINNAEGESNATNKIKIKFSDDSDTSFSSLTKLSIIARIFNMVIDNISGFILP